MSHSPAALVLRDDGEPPAPWESALNGIRRTFGSAPADLAGVECVLVDGRAPDALERVRRVHAADPAVQNIVVADGEARARIERSILFTPGLGEVWVTPADAIDAALVERAAGITRTRRDYRRTSGRVHRQLASLERPAERRTIISDAYLAALLEAAPDPIISIDDEGIVLSWNPGAEHVLGYAATHALGRPLPEVLVAADPGQPLPLDTLTEPRRMEFEFVRRDGESGIGDLLVLPIGAAGQRVRAVMLRDLTAERRAQAALEAQTLELESQAVEMEEQAAELAQINDELQQRTLELEEASSARARFYAAMSHELRTPVNAILGFQDLLLAGLHGELNDEQRSGLERAQRAARHLVELVNDVLDMAKIEAGRIDLQIEPTHLPKLLDELLDTVASLAEQHGTTVTIEGTGTHTFDTDPRRLRQIVLNLLSNAIKFGAGKPIRVLWEAAPDGGARVEVIDQGRGIAPEDLERIFEEFTQVGAASDSGTGLGLSISRRLALLLGGSLAARSQPGAGSTFTLTLPARPPQR